MFLKIGAKHKRKARSDAASKMIVSLDVHTPKQSVLLQCWTLTPLHISAQSSRSCNGIVTRRRGSSTLQTRQSAGVFKLVLRQV